MPKPLYSGTWHTTSRRLRNAANANPDTRCGICGRTLAQHPPTKTGRAQTWDVDHIEPGNPHSSLRIAAMSCNRSLGASMGNQQRNDVPCDW